MTVTKRHRETIAIEGSWGGLRGRAHGEELTVTDDRGKTAKLSKEFPKPE